MFARIAEVKEMVAAIGAEHVSLVAPLPERQSLGDGTVIQVSSRSLIVESLYQFAPCGAPRALECDRKAGAGYAA